MIKKILIIIVGIGTLLCNITKIKAEEKEYSISKRRFPDIYAVYDGVDRVHLFYAQSYVINNQQAYCLEPGVAINTNYYYATEDLSMSGLTDDILKKIRLIGYYGFNYPTHTDNNYYMAAQEMIWELITGREVYWVNEEDINGQRINIDYQKKIIQSLIDNHYTKPSFDDEEIIMEVGKTYTLEDTNHVLSKYKIYEASINNISINNNNLVITPSSISESGDIKIISNTYTDRISLLYYRGDNQKLISSTGILEPVISSFKIKIIDNPYLKVVKKDKDTDKQIQLGGIKFKIKNLDTGEYICENDECIYETDSNGTFITKNKMTYGNYQLEEIDSLMDGYLWNKQALNFTIDENSEYKEENDKMYFELTFKNEAVTGKVEITKMGETPVYQDNLIMYQDYLLDNVVFNLYSKDIIYYSDNTIRYNKDEFIGTYKTNNGKIIIDNLPLGNYYIKEVSTQNNHILDLEKHYFTLKYIDEYTDVVVVSLTIKNYLAKGILEFTKLDSITGDYLPNTKIAIYNQNDEIIFIGETNDKGKIILEGLPLGKYYIKELKAPEGYELKDDNIFFEIKNNDEIVNTTMENTIIDVPSTNLNRNYYCYIASGIILIVGIFLYKYEK